MGMEKGREEGEYQKSLKIAKVMKDKGVSVDLISEYTGLNLEQIENL